MQEKKPFSTIKPMKPLINELTYRSGSLPKPQLTPKLDKRVEVEGEHFYQNNLNLETINALKEAILKNEASTVIKDTIKLPTSKPVSPFQMEKPKNESKNGTTLRKNQPSMGIKAHSLKSTNNNCKNLYANCEPFSCDNNNNNQVKLSEMFEDHYDDYEDHEIQIALKSATLKLQKKSIDSVDSKKGVIPFLDEVQGLNNSSKSFRPLTPGIISKYGTLNNGFKPSSCAKSMANIYLQSNSQETMQRNKNIAIIKVPDQTIYMNMNDMPPPRPPKLKPVDRCDSAASSVRFMPKFSSSSVSITSASSLAYSSLDDTNLSIASCYLVTSPVSTSSKPPLPTSNIPLYFKSNGNFKNHSDTNMKIIDESTLV